MVRYVRENFFKPTVTRLLATGQTLTLDVLNAQLHRWLNAVANARIHRQTKRQPQELMLEEASRLLPLPQASSAQTLRAHLRQSDAAKTPVVIRETRPIQRPLAGYQQIQEAASWRR
jgi:hypothetical protein